MKKLPGTALPLYHSQQSNAALLLQRTPGVYVVSGN